VKILYWVARFTNCTLRFLSIGNDPCYFDQTLNLPCWMVLPLK